MRGSSNHRRWRQFSLKGLLVLMLLACVGLAVLVRRAKQELQLVAELKAMGVMVHARASSNSDDWLRGFTDSELLGVTYSVHFTNAPTPDQLKKLKTLSNLESIYIEYEGRITESQLDSMMGQIERELPDGIRMSISGQPSGGLWMVRITETGRSHPD